MAINRIISEFQGCWVARIWRVPRNEERTSQLSHRLALWNWQCAHHFSSLRFCRADLGRFFFFAWRVLGNLPTNCSANFDGDFFQRLFRPCFSRESATPPKKNSRSKFTPKLVGIPLQFHFLIVSRWFSAYGGDQLFVIGNRKTQLSVTQFDKISTRYESRARKPWSAHCELKHWNLGGGKCLIHGLHFTGKPLPNSRFMRDFCL